MEGHRVSALAIAFGESDGVAGDDPASVRF